MSEPTMVKTMRVTPEGWAAFETFRRDLERALPFGRVPLHEAFQIAVGSASAALANGQIPVRPDRRDDQAA